MVWIAILLAMALLYFHMETKRFVIRRYPVHSGRLPKEFDKVKLAVLSDLHNNEFGKGNKRLLQAIQQENPECILIAGDMIVGTAGTSTETAGGFLRELEKQFPGKVYYGVGNHEHRIKLYPEKYGGMYADYIRNLEQTGLRLLENEMLVYKKHGKSISMYFPEIGKEYYKRLKDISMEVSYLDSLLGKPDKSRYNIMVAHHPSYFETYAEWGADLVLSGHHHGGIVHLPFLGGLISPSCHFFPKYDAGRFEYKDSVMILSAGLGSHTIPFRVFNPPELIILELQSEEKSGMINAELERKKDRWEYQ